MLLATMEQQQQAAPFRPIRDGVLVRQVPPDTKTPSGILYYPDKAKEWPAIGDVLAVGPGSIDDDGERIPMSVKPGDRVIFRRRGSTELEHMRSHDADRTLLLHDDDMLAVIEP